jgi:DNA invertase Pin-like site-specific DNA recombinase
MKLGYARVSTSEQDTAAQISALEAAGCERFYTDQASGARWDRPELQRLLTELRPDDTMVVWKLDRASRSLKDLLTLIDRLGEADAHFSSLTEHIDTGTPAGRMMLQMVGAFAEFEREMLRERTKAGLEQARKAGRIGGRRPKLTTEQRQAVIHMVGSGEKTATDAARLFQVHKSTVTRLMAREGVSVPKAPVRCGPMAVSRSC